MNDIQQLTSIIEAALFAHNEPLTLEQLVQLFPQNQEPSAALVQQAIEQLQMDYANRAVQLSYTASGYQFIVHSDYSPWVQRLWQDKPPKYSKAMLETIAIIAYRQPITRSEIEEVRGVRCSTQLIKNLQEREWVKIVGHRDLPGKPALLATTQHFLDYFGLQSLQQLPALDQFQVDQQQSQQLEMDEALHLEHDQQNREHKL